MTDFTSMSDADLDRFIADKLEPEAGLPPIGTSDVGQESPCGFWYVRYGQYPESHDRWQPHAFSTDRNATYAAWMALGVLKQDWIPHSLEPATSNFTVGFLVAMSAPTRQLAEWIAAALLEEV